MKIKNLISIISIASLITFGGCKFKRDLPLYTETMNVLEKWYTVEIRPLNKNGTMLRIYENGADRTESKWNGVSFARDIDGKIDQLQGPIPYNNPEVDNELNKILEHFQERK